MANEKERSSEEEAEHSLFLGSRKAMLGGLLAGAVILIGQALIGGVYSGYKARQLLEGVAASSHYLASSIVTAAATIIALMLTIIGLTRRSEGEFDSVFFKRIQRIAFLSTIALIAGILLLLFLSIPVQESDQVPVTYFWFLYYMLITFVAMLSGLVVGIVLMLLNAINSLIDVIRPSFEEDIEKAKEKEESAE